MGLVALIVLTVGWLAVFAALVLDFAGVKRQLGGTPWRWMAVGLLVSDGSLLVIMLALVRGWSYGRELTRDGVVPLTALAGAAIAVPSALVVLGRQRDRARQGGHSPG